MTKPVKTIRRETGLIEGVCEHGCGHPLFGSIDWMDKNGPKGAKGTWGIHGCDGCCDNAEWQISTLEESVRIANDIIIQHKHYIRTNEVLNVKTAGD